MTSGLTTKQQVTGEVSSYRSKAPINRINGGTGTAQSEVADLTYGGTVANDCLLVQSNTIEYAGTALL
jgi:hypothetical protein